MKSLLKKKNISSLSTLSKNLLAITARGCLVKLQLSLFCFVGSLCLQVVTLNLGEAFFSSQKSSMHLPLSENKFETQITKRKQKNLGQCL